MKTGRKPTFKEKTVRTTVILPKSTFEKMKVFIVKDKSISNAADLMNKAILYMIEENTQKGVFGFDVNCKYCGKHAVKKSPTAKYCSDGCRIADFYKRKYSSPTPE